MARPSPSHEGESGCLGNPKTKHRCHTEGTCCRRQEEHIGSSAPFWWQVTQAESITPTLHQVPAMLREAGRDQHTWAISKGRDTYAGNTSPVSGDLASHPITITSYICLLQCVYIYVFIHICMHVCVWRSIWVATFGVPLTSIASWSPFRCAEVEVNLRALPRSPSCKKPFPHTLAHGS